MVWLVTFECLCCAVMCVCGSFFVSWRVGDIYGVGQDLGCLSCCWVVVCVVCW